jgi:C4-type Zn-finger protein
MAYQIPSDQMVLDAVKKVLQRYHTVSSQHQLKTLVEIELRSTEQRLQVSEPRLRMLVVRSGLAQVEIHTREGDSDKMLRKCPVCGALLQRVKNQTIYGGEVTLEYRCSVCGYWTGKKKKIPTLYIFHSP